MLAPTTAAITRPAAANNSTRVHSSVRKTEVKSTDWNHMKSVQKFAANTNAAMMTTTVAATGASNLDRRGIRAGGAPGDRKLTPPPRSDLVGAFRCACGALLQKT